MLKDVGMTVPRKKCSNTGDEGSIYIYMQQNRGSINAARQVGDEGGMQQ